MTNSSPTRLRLASILFLVAGLFLTFSLTDLRGSLQSRPSPNAVPGSGTLNPDLASTVNWTGATALAPNPNDETTCIEGVNCDTFLITLSGTPADWLGKKAHIEIQWPANGDDYDFFVHKGADNTGPVVGSAATSGASPEVVELDPSNPAIATGQFSVHVVYFLITPGDVYHGAASVVGGAVPTPTPSPGVTPTPPPMPGAPRYQIYESPAGVADDAGEPSNGVNWNSEQSFTNNNITTGAPNPPIPNGGTSTYFGGFLSYMLAVGFDDCSSPANATWNQKPLSIAATTRAAGDPILFTDRGWPAYPGMPEYLGTGRTFVSQLEGLTPAGSTTEYTDDDGDTFLPSEGGAPSGIDHQTLGGGPFHAPLPPGLTYPNAVYYASQSIAAATSELSFDGGITFPFQTPMFTALDCAGLHGHIKVAPDGTAFVPDKGCASTGVPLLDGGLASAIVSEDNNATWQIRPIPNAMTNGNDDPSIGVATDSNTIFLGYQALDGHARIAVSHDKGVTWQHDTDVGILAGVQNCAFPAVVAGDGEQNGANTSRAAFAYFGTETAGTDADQPTFPGVWYLYVSTTYDGGLTWITENVTPGDPIQRGGICGDGACRNLLDFFGADIDREGRVVIGGEDGCIGGCVNGGANSFTAKGFLARQSGGKRMYAQYDPVEPNIPGAPAVTATISGTTVNLSWPVPDSGGSLITGYKVYRGTGGVFVPIATVTQPNYIDTAFTPGSSYRVTALNALGQSPYCHDIVPTAPIPPPNTCDLPGALVINDTNPDGSDADMAPNTPPDGSVNVRQLFIAEPFIAANQHNFVFTIQAAPSLTGSAPTNSQWYIIWNRHNATAEFDRFYVAMKTDASGATSFEYGNFGVALDPTNPSPTANTPVRIGDADAGSYDPGTGLITISLDATKAEMADGGYGAGNDLSGLNVRTFFNRIDPGQRSQNNASDITSDATYHIAGNAACAPAATLVRAVSRLTHGTAGTFDIRLAPGTPGTLAIEPRNGEGGGGTYHIVFLFAEPVTYTGATSSSGAATVNPGSGPASEVSVDLTGVSATPQIMTVTLQGVTAGGGAAPADMPVQFGLLVGDVNSNGTVNGTDVGQAKTESGHAADADNFRADVTPNGAINGTDVGLIKTKSGTSLPPANPASGRN